MSDSVSLTPKRVTTRRSKEEILSFITAYEQVKDQIEPEEFCRSHGICPGTFYTWRKLEHKNGKYSGAGKAKIYGRFLELRADPPVDFAGPAVAVPEPPGPLFASIVVSGSTVHLHQCVSPDYIRLLLGL